jgi:hypothetical protein
MSVGQIHNQYHSSSGGSLIGQLVGFNVSTGIGALSASRHQEYRKPSARLPTDASG